MRRLEAGHELERDVVLTASVVTGGVACTGLVHW
jgi:hypothetical protein